VTLHQADMRQFETRKRFDFAVAAFHTVSHLYSHDDISSFLRQAFRHLKPGGRLIFDLPLPRIDVPSYDSISQVRVTEIDAPKGVQLLTQRWYQPQEIMMHVYYAGFRNAKLCSDFGTGPVDGETSIFTVSARHP
jgi:predicted SAM-dependent methyltransferase